LEKVLKNVLETAGLYGKDQEFHFPLITKSGINGKDKNVHYYSYLIHF